MWVDGAKPVLVSAAAVARVASMPDPENTHWSAPKPIKVERINAENARTAGAPCERVVATGKTPPAKAVAGSDVVLLYG